MENLLEHLNQEQLAAVTHKEGPLMIIAGAGTGKTTVITHRIGWLIEQKLAKPEEILALTFTEKAAAEMEERVDRLLPYGYIDLQISTFHAFCERLLREYGVEMGLSPDFILLNELDAWLLMRKEFERFDLDYYRPLGNPTRYIKSFLHHFSRAKDELITPEMYLKHAQEQEADLDTMNSTEEGNSEVARLQELAHAYHLYQRILLENDALDFGDLISYTIQLLQKRPLILKKIRERFRFVLVDEFQDTNLAQYELVKQIAAPINNITVVGDDDQSIYKFRGASLSNILQFESDYPESHRVILTQNYRSAQNILDYAYTFIQANNPYRLEACGNGKEIEKKLRSQRKEEGIVQHLHYATVEEEVRGVIQKMVDLKNADESLEWKDFGILVRANSSADVFVEALEQVGIPYQFMALRGLYTKPVILDVLAWMRIVDHPFDSVSFYRVLTHGPFTIPTEDLLRLNHLAYKKGKSLFEVTKEISLLTEYDAKTIVLVQRLLSLLSGFAQEAKEKTCAELFLLITKDSGLTSFIDHYPEAQKQEAFRFLQKFYTRLRQFELRHPQKDLHHFLKEFEQEQEAGESGALSIDVEIGPDVVHVMTVHGSKGLEFRYVFVVNLVDRRFPTIERKDPIELPSELVKESLPDGDRHLQEERRLFYVAMTRAKDGLYFTSAEDYGGMRKKKLSRFLMELGIEKTLLEKQINPLKGQDDGHQKSFSLSSDYKYTLPKRFSFTQLTAFETCPLQYKYAHLLKIPMLGKWTFSYGKTMHHTLQRYF